MNHVIPDDPVLCATTLSAYAQATSCVQGGSLRFCVSAPDGGPLRGSVVIFDDTNDRPVARFAFEGPVATFHVPLSLPSSLYRAVFSPGGSEAYFVVRAARPGMTSPVLVSVPFLTWQAYNRAGEPGESIYWTEQPDRAFRVSFDRPGGGPAPERWEHGLFRWLSRTGYRVEYCSAIDLHERPEIIDHYQLLVFNGHDEYWTKEMRDVVEAFAAKGGNLAFFGANTCWWQARLEDHGRTLVCYRDAAEDPMSWQDPARTTVEWSSAPVNRPPNALTGASFLRGAGHWTEMHLMDKETYSVRFAEHWVFEGTGLRDGDRFGAGALGYETDAADYEEIEGVPYATGRDGTPPSFVILATADLRHWRSHGQGGGCTMGVLSLGRGVVFNAATVRWGNALGDPVVERITLNVLDRLSKPARLDEWDDSGPARDIRSIVVCDNRLFGVDDEGRLHYREISGQNLPWRVLDPEADLRHVTAPRESAAGTGLPLGLYGVTTDERLVYRDAVVEPAPWRVLGRLPAGTEGLAGCYVGIFAVARSTLWHISFADLAAGRSGEPSWRALGHAPRTAALAASNGRLFLLTSSGTILSRGPELQDSPWREYGETEGARGLAAFQGRLLVSTSKGRLAWREAAAVPAAVARGVR